MSGPPRSYDPEAVNPERLRQTAERMGWAGTDDLEAEREWVDALIRFWEANLTFMHYLIEKARTEDPNLSTEKVLPDTVREILSETAGATYLLPRWDHATFLDGCIAKVAAEPVGMLGPDPAPTRSEHT